MEEGLTALQICPRGIFELVRELKVDSKDVEGGRTGRW